MKSLTEQYKEFADEVKHQRRHFFSEASKAFLAELKKLAEEKVLTIAECQ